MLEPIPFAEKLRELRGNIAAVARAFGVSRQAAQQFVERHPELKEVRAEAREAVTDLAESRLYEAIHAGQFRAIKYFLDTHGASRAYGRGALQARLDALQKEINELLMRVAARSQDNGDGDRSPPKAP